MSIQRISLLTMVIVAAAALEGKHDPKNKCRQFDGNYDCPNYEVLETNDVSSILGVFFLQIRH